MPGDERPPPPPKAIQRYAPTGAFAERIMAACFTLSASVHTRTAYWNDARYWLAFCQERQRDPALPDRLTVAAWLAEMTAAAPKTRARRVSALCAIYRQLYRDGQVPANPFSVADGPARERAHPLARTRAAPAAAVRYALAACAADGSTGLRDAAIIRILWGTGIRRSSLVAMTCERLEDAPDGAYEAELPAKGGTQIRVLVRGKAADALRAWIVANGCPPGPTFRNPTTGLALTTKEIWRIVTARGHGSGFNLTPHTFRAAFLTVNPAPLDAKQDAAGHADPATTRSYDRALWRGRAAFEQMPEVEDVK